MNDTGDLDSVGSRKIEDDVAGIRYSVAAHCLVEFRPSYAHVRLLSQHLESLVQSGKLPVRNVLVGYPIVVVPYPVEIAYSKGGNAIGRHQRERESLPDDRRSRPRRLTSSNSSWSVSSVHSE